MTEQNNQPQMEKLNLEHLTKDPEIISYINKKKAEGLSMESIIEQILSVGVAVLQRVQSSRDVEFVKQETEKLVRNFQNTVAKLEEEISKKVESQISDLFNPDLEDSYTKKFGNFLNENLGQFRNDIKQNIVGAKEVSELLIKSTKELNEEKMSKIESGIKTAENNFNPELETSYFGKIKNIVTDVNSNLHNQLDDQKVGSFAHRLKEDASHLFGEDSPIIKTIEEIITNKTKEFNDHILKLREEIAKEQGKDEGVKETMEKSALKGRSFELDLLESLEDIAKSFGDIVEYTGDIAENGTTSKKGDFIYTLNTGQAIVIEAKDRELGMKPSLKYLNDTMQVRGVNFSIIVFKNSEQLPRQAGPFNFYEDNKVFTCMDYLKFAIQWSRIYLNKAENKLVDGVNETLVLQRIEDILNKFKDISNLKTKLTQMQSSVNSNTDSIRDIVDRLKDDVIIYLNDIENEFIKSGSKQSDVFDIEDKSSKEDSIPGLFQHK